MGDLAPIIALIMIIPLCVSGLIVYSSYAAGRMAYVLGEDGLRVKFSLAPLMLKYQHIKGAGKVETSLGFRLFGGSLPGSHWGTFATSNVGNVQVYATRARGEFVLLELVDGVKVLISPLEPDAFLEALRGKTALAAPTLAEVEPPRLDRGLAFGQVAVVTIAWLALVAYVASIYPGLPEVIPVHFGLDGVPNRYGSKVEMLLLVALSTIFPAMNAVFALKFGKYNRGLTTFLGVVFLFALGLFALVFNQVLQAI
ncbi:MAG: PH domain-containing protein [Candidatus Bathyarchaeia archaeon]